MGAHPNYADAENRDVPLVRCQLNSYQYNVSCQRTSARALAPLAQAHPNVEDGLPPAYRQAGTPP